MESPRGTHVALLLILGRRLVPLYVLVIFLAPRGLGRLLVSDTKKILQTNHHNLALVAPIQKHAPKVRPL